jgi:N-acetylneuraminic acid mutarotase
MLIGYSFGGTDGVQWFNDVWTYDPRSNQWSQQDCIGYIPQPREGHSAALVNDVMYIFGGRTQDGDDLGDLAAFRITSRRWYTFQNMGPSPSPRSGHSMTAFDKQIVVVGGEPSSTTRDEKELCMVYCLDTSKIRYPNDQQIQQTPTGERVAGNRRPSGDRNGPPRGAAPREGQRKCLVYHTCNLLT